MTRALSTLLLAAMFATGCPTRPKVQADNNDAGAHADAGSLTVTLQITSPTDGTYVSSKVSFTATASVEQASLTVSLLDGQNLLANVIGPSPYTYVWDTSGVAEGPHQIIAQTIANGRSVTSLPITINVDHTAPTVTATTPATGATDVVLRAPITATFSEPIAPASLTTSGAVTLTIAGKGAPATISLSADGKTATIVPTSLASIALPASCGVSFASSITDLAGNALVAPTPAWSWMVPEWVTYPALTTTTASLTPKLGNPHLAITNDLRPVLSYTDAYLNQSGYEQYAALVVQAFAGTAWESLGSPSPTNLLNDQLGHFLALDSNDYPVVVWSNGTTNSDFIYLAAWNGTTWGAVTPSLDASTGPATTSAIKPVVRMNGMGRPVVGWAELIPGSSSGDVFVATWTGTEWDKSLGGLHLSDPSNLDLTFNDAGNPVVGWLDGVSCGASIWNGTAWVKSPVLQAIPSLMTGRTTIVFDATANPVILSNGPPTPFAIEELISGSWQQSIENPSSLSIGSFPFLAASPDHALSLAWLDTGTVNLARRTAGKWDLRATKIASTNGMINSDFDFVVDAQGEAWFAWDDGKTMNVWMSNYPVEP